MTRFTFLNLAGPGLPGGQETIVRAFQRAFDRTDPVCLWMLGAETSPRLSRLCRDSPLSHKIRLSPPPKEPTALAESMNLVDCGVFAGEVWPWNAGLLQMMACGRRVIAPEAGGHRDFAHAGNCRLVQGSDDEALAEALRLAFREGRLANPTGAKAAGGFSWQRSAREILAFVLDTT